MNARTIIKAKLLIFSFFIFISNISNGQELSLPLAKLNFPGEAISLGVGSAMNGFADCPAGVLFNPATLGSVQQKTLMVGGIPGYGYFKRNMIYFLTARQKVSFAFGFDRISNAGKGIWQSQNYPNYFQTYSLLMAFPTSSKFSLGLRTRVKDQIFDSNRKVGYGIDAGIAITASPWFSIGGFINNIIQTDDLNGKLIQNKQEQFFSAGFSIHPPILPVSLNFDFNYNQANKKTKPAGGLQYNFKDALFPRLGFFDNQIFIGLGGRYSDFSLNYAFSFSDKNPSHYLTFTHSFGTRIKERNEAKKLFILANDALKKGESMVASFLAKDAFKLDSLNRRIRSLYEKLKNIADLNADSTVSDNFISISKQLRSAVNFKAENLGPVVNSSQNDGLPVLTADGKTMFFTSTRDGGIFLNPSEDFWYTTMRDSIWQKPVNLGTPVNTPLNEGACSISSDGQMIFLSKQNEADHTGLDLYVSKLNGTIWSEPKDLGANINSRYWDAHPSISNDRKSLYFASNRPGGFRGYDIWVTHFVNGKWSKAENLGPQINSSANERYPYIFFDSKTLYFSSDREGGLGGFDIYMSRMDKNGNWTKPVNAGLVFNSNRDEISFIIEPSGQWAYFASDREGGLGGLDIYKIKVPEVMKPDKVITVKGKILDSEGNPLGAIVVAKDLETGEELFRAESNSETGEYMLALPVGKVYTLLIMSGDNYISREEKLDLTDIQFYQEVKNDYSLYYSAKKVFITGRISDFYSDEPIGAQLRVEVLETGEEIAKFYSDLKNGRYQVEVPVDRNYNISVTADNYFFESEKVYTKNEIQDNEKIEKNFKLKLVRVGEKIKINNILFDFNEATVRPETFVELNRAADLLKKYTGIGIEIGGHTDSKGPESYNLRLSQARCDSVKSYLLKQGIEGYRIVTKGYGESQPVADNNTEESRQLNRRTEFTIIETKDLKKNFQNK